ncbi:YaaC family protein [Alteribacter aurantiacus]|uniref:YaaC family protein n=1 Tax=Alteribacter aurantiacus TaxID=254410 RepID=UPI0003FAFBE3|nr:YaaC family protein [Alteribacter aurantiacus]
MTSHPFLLPFQSIDYVKSFLAEKYEELGVPNAGTLAYKNGYPFLYYLEMGKQYVSQSEIAPLSTQPVLLFYGCVQWMKATLLTVDPEYPGTTQVLAHGVTARKRKKQDYSFLEDEVKVQKEGLFPYFSEQMFHVKQLTGEKYKLNHVLKRIPAMAGLFEKLYGSKPLTEVTFSDDHVTIPTSTLGHLEMELPRFLALLKESNIRAEGEVKDQCAVISNGRIISSHPYLILQDGERFYLPNDRDSYLPLPELLAHYVILYNLSMICRYETEWWCELLHSFSSNDFPCIEHFLTISKQKLPSLFEDLLTGRTKK